MAWRGSRAILSLLSARIERSKYSLRVSLHVRYNVISFAGLFEGLCKIVLRTLTRPDIFGVTNAEALAGVIRHHQRHVHSFYLLRATIGIIDVKGRPCHDESRAALWGIARGYDAASSTVSYTLDRRGLPCFLRRYVIVPPAIVLESNRRESVRVERSCLHFEFSRVRPCMGPIGRLTAFDLTDLGHVSHCFPRCSCTQRV